MKFDIKKFLKALKLNENRISMILGAIVIVVTVSLVVNYFKDRSSKGRLLENAGETTQTGFAKTHTVTKGENLWKIAEIEIGSGYNWTDIAKENKLTNPGLIYEGQKLDIPSVEPTIVGSLQAKPAAIESSAVSITGATYEVVKGDNLWNIAIRAYGDGYKWSEIARENRLVNPSLIHPGNILALPR